MEQMKCEPRGFWPDSMDLSHGSMSSGSPVPSSSCGAGDSGLKSCADCQTTKTPLWRAGPSGPKSLCNACGIRYRKNRRGAPGLREAGAKGGKEKGEICGGDGFGLSFKIRMVGLGLCKPRSPAQKQRRKRSILMKEEEAAVLLMALSSGLLYA